MIIMPFLDQIEDDSLSKLFLEFGLGTTSHGIPRIFSAKSPLSRILWLLLVVGSFSVFLWQASTLVIQYLKYDVVVTYSVDNANGGAQPFPAVTICNTNRVMKTKMKKSNQFKLADVDKLRTLRYYGPCLFGDRACDDGTCYKPFRRCNGMHDCKGGDDEMHCAYGPCEPNKFTCESGSPVGRCIPQEFKCDRRPHCYDKEDEKDCHPHEVHCTDDEFRCDTGLRPQRNKHFESITGTPYCIKTDFVCDGVAHCSDAQDEQICSCNFRTEYACYDFKKASCIPQSSTCDGVEDCYDGRDEKVPCTFTCDDGVEVKSVARCNLHVDCADESDEIGCDWDSINPCNTEGTAVAGAVVEWRCDNAECILNSTRCDRRRDCKDGSDELNCPCDESEFYICNNGECVDRYARCNGIPDCIDAMDEDDCQPIVQQRIENKAQEMLNWDDKWYENCNLTIQNPEIFDRFHRAFYKDRGFHRVLGETPPDWVGFMTFSQTPDYSDLADVLKLSRSETAEMGHDGDKFVQQCAFDQKPCHINDFYPFQHDKYGNCYTFNSGKDFHLDKNFRNVTNKRAAFYKGKGGRVRRTSTPGAQCGLKLTLFVEQHEFIGVFGQDVGVRVVVHPQDAVPFPEDMAITASTGRLTSVAIKKKVINRQAKPYGNCTETVMNTDDKDIKAQMFPGYGYSVQACLKSCYQENLLKHCACVDTLLIEDTPRCKMLNGEQERCRQLILFLAQENLLNCTCPPACSEMNYEKIVSQSAWPSKSYFSRLLQSIWEKQQENRQVLFDDKSVEDNLVRLEVFFEELSFVNIAEHPAYKIENLLGDIGGSLGLYIGLSLLTVFEFGEFVVCAFKLLCRRFTNRNQNKVEELAPTK